MIGAYVVKSREGHVTQNYVAKFFSILFHIYHACFVTLFIKMSGNITRHLRWLNKTFWGPYDSFRLDDYWETWPTSLCQWYMLISLKTGVEIISVEPAGIIWVVKIMFTLKIVLAKMVIQRSLLCRVTFLISEGPLIALFCFPSWKGF